MRNFKENLFVQETASKEKALFEMLVQNANKFFETVISVGKKLIFETKEFDSLTYK